MNEREILFRGKRTDNGKWECGDLLSPNEFNAIPHIVYIAYLNEYGDIGEISTPVIPETVGQFTGLTDKNGKRIFEGDICRFKRFNDVHIGKIVFNATTASFVMWYQPIVGAYGEKATQKMLLSVCDDIEVIGNIHDNPELLGGENNGINR